MITYRDMAFCADAEQCKNKTDCHRWFSPVEQVKAEEWMKDAPVAFMQFKNRCDKWEEQK